MMIDADLETVADALVTLSQVHGSKPGEFALATAKAVSAVAAAAKAPPAGRTKRERKLPAKLTSGDYVCEPEGMPVPKSARASYEQAHPQHDAYDADVSYLPVASSKAAYHPAYSVPGHTLHYSDYPPSGASASTAMAAFASSSKRKQRMPSPSPAYCSQALPAAAQKGCSSYSMVLEALPWHGGLPRGSVGSYKVKEEQAPIIQVYARPGSAVHEDGTPVLEAELVWDSNIYFVTRRRAVRGSRLQKV